MTTNALDQAALNGEVAKYVSRGYAVESSAPGHVILSKKARIGVFWNVLLSIVTGGICQPRVLNEVVITER